MKKLRKKKRQVLCTVITIIIFNIMGKHRRVQVDLNMARGIKVTDVVKYVQIKAS